MLFFSLSLSLFQTDKKYCNNNSVVLRFQLRCCILFNLKYMFILPLLSFIIYYISCESLILSITVLFFSVIVVLTYCFYFILSSFLLNCHFSRFSVIFFFSQLLSFFFSLFILHVHLRLAFELTVYHLNTVCQKANWQFLY